MSVLVAVDGSELSTRAVRAGLDLLGDVSDAVVVTVVDSVDAMEVTGTGFAGGTMTPQQYEERERALEAEGAEVVAAAKAALGLPDAETLVLRGHPGTALCELAEARAARAIVIGSRGLGGFKRALLGSVSDHVVRNAPCPVVVTSASD